MTEVKDRVYGNPVLCPWMRLIDQAFTFCRQWILQSLPRVKQFTGGEPFYVSDYMKELKNLTQVFLIRMSGTKINGTPVAFLTDKSTIEAQEATRQQKERDQVTAELLDQLKIQRDSALRTKGDALVEKTRQWYLGLLDWCLASVALRTEKLKQVASRIEAIQRTQRDQRARTVQEVAWSFRIRARRYMENIGSFVREAHGRLDAILGSSSRIRFTITQVKERFTRRMSETNQRYETSLRIWQAHTNGINRVLDRYPLLKEHINVLKTGLDSEGALRFGRGDAYILYRLMGYAGKYYQDILHHHFGFPAYKRILKWRGECLMGTIGRDLIFNQTFDPADTETVLTAVWGVSGKSCWRNERVVIAVDAASLSPNLKVTRRGDVRGTVNSQTTDKPLTELVRQQATVCNIATHAFTFLIIPVEKKYSQVPLKLQWSTSGSAGQAQEDLLGNIIHLLRRVELDPIGIASDGDVFWLSYAILFLQKFVAKMKKGPVIFDTRLEKLCDMLSVLKWFHDLLHLVKCDRYHKLKPKNQAIVPFCNRFVFSFTAVAKKLNVSGYLLNDSQTKKMDDFLPIRLFKTRLMFEALKQQEVGFCYSITPSCLLLSVCFDQSLTRVQRLDLLNLAFGIIMAQYIYRLSPLHRDTNVSDVNSASCEHMNLWQQDWIEKSLHLCASVAAVLADPRPVNLGALGSHILEHLFGYIRRVCAGNNEKEAFERAILEYIDLKSLKGSLSEPVRNKRRSDSGVNLPACSERERHESSHPIGWYIAVGWRMMQIASRYLIPFPEELPSQYEAEAMRFDSLAAIFEIINLPIDKPTTNTSLKQMGVVCSSGLVNSRQNAERSDIEMLKKK